MKLAMPKLRRRGRSVCAVACLTLFAVFQLFASVPELHHWIHADSNDRTHQCELTLLTQGQVNISDAQTAIATVTPLLLSAAVPVDDYLPLPCQYQLPPGRAPPLA
jgi:hypothetical protein